MLLFDSQYYCRDRVVISMASGKAYRVAYLLFSLFCLLVAWPSVATAGQADRLRQLVRRSRGPVHAGATYEPDQVTEAASSAPPSYVVPQGGRSMRDDRIVELPGQPAGNVDFEQYAGYVTVDSTRGRALFYYFVESPQDAPAKPLVLWLNGGPGCSSLGYGAMEELGPFRVNSDGRTLYRNEYAWNNVANVLFLESPAGVGFSYSNTSSDYETAGDTRTAMDAYIFLINWLERFPRYRNRDFYITGESFAGHYAPELAATIISHGPSAINLKGVAIGNPYLGGYFSKVDANTRGAYDFLWSHALISDESHAAFISQCKYPDGNLTGSCVAAMGVADDEVGNINYYNIYAPLCHSRPRPQMNSSSPGSVTNFDPCSSYYVTAYLNREEVKRALHARTSLPRPWSHCSSLVNLRNWRDMPDSMLPTIRLLINSGTRIWIYSGDTDSVVSVTSTKYSLSMLGLPVEKPWRPWIHEGEVGGYVVGYKGLTFATVRGAGHEVPSYQPGRSLTMFAAFIQGRLPPSA